MEVHLYKTAGLIPSNAQPDELNRWEKLIVRTVDRDSWQTYGGTGSVLLVQGTGPEGNKPWFFVISQTPVNHTQIKTLLLGLDKNLVIT